MNGASARHVIVEPGGAGVVAHVWLHALGSFADRLGLGGPLSSHIRPTRMSKSTLRRLKDSGSCGFPSPISAPTPTR